MNFAKNQADLPLWPMWGFYLVLVLGPYVPSGLITAAATYLVALGIIGGMKRRAELPRALVVFFWCFGLLLAIGLAGSVSNDTYLILKDAWYFFNVPILVAFGFMLARASPDLDRALRVLVAAAVTLACLHLARFAVEPELLTLPATEVRIRAGNGELLVGLGFALLVLNMRRWRSSLHLSVPMGSLASLICLASVFLSFSRTLVIVLVIFMLGLKGLLERRKFPKIIAIIGAVGIVAVAATLAMPSATEDEKKTFIGKLARSLDELTISNYRDLQSINDNYRGYETSRALLAYSQGNPAQWLFGRGFGYEVDLGLYLKLGGDYLKFIPVFHNGLIYVLIKTGVVGLTIFFGSLAVLFLWRFDADAEAAADVRFRIIRSCVLICLVTSWLIGGPFNKNALLSVVVILGLCIGLCGRKTETETAATAPAPCLDGTS